VWHTFSLTHIPRIEDFPVMPCEIITVGLKPSNFFTANPALDVPASEQHFNKSILYEDETNIQERTVGKCGC
jgi:primary-amine oxidase